jgi:uncharacterized protein YdaU (DUF1376 family)
MPLDWGDYWRDTGHLNAAEHGAYLNLLGAYWVSAAPLPDDDQRLCRMAKTTRAEWRKLRGTVRAFFTLHEGALHQARVDRELSRAAEVHARYAQGAKLTNAKRHAQREHAASLSVSPSDTPSPSPSHPESGPSGPGADAPFSGMKDDSMASLKTRIFGPCLAWLTAQSKLPDARARAVIGRWCAKYGDGPVLEAFSAAARQAPLDPVPYIEKVLHNAALEPSTAHSTTTTGPAAAAFRSSGNGQPRAVRAARATAIDHLAGLRDALGLGGVETLLQPAAPAERDQSQSDDRRVEDGADAGQ